MAKPSIHGQGDRDGLLVHSFLRSFVRFPSDECLVILYLVRPCIATIPYSLSPFATCLSRLLLSRAHLAMIGRPGGGEKAPPPCLFCFPGPRCSGRVRAPGVEPNIRVRGPHNYIVIHAQLGPGARIVMKNWNHLAGFGSARLSAQLLAGSNSPVGKERKNF